MHKPITSRIRSIVDGLLVHCHGRSEFESRHRTLCVCFFFGFYIFINYLFIDIVHYHFQTISVDKYRFNDCKQCYPIELMHSVVSCIYVPCLIMSHLMGILYKC